jgi:hypothetical protein
MKIQGTPVFGLLTLFSLLSEDHLGLGRGLQRPSMASPPPSRRMKPSEPSMSTLRGDSSRKDQNVDVLIATRRNRRVEFFDASSLELLGSFAIHHLAHSVCVSPNGRTLYIQQAAEPDGNSCCALFSLDLATKVMCRMIEPSSPAVPTRDGLRIFTQRGNVGIEVFDANTLVRLPTIQAPGTYRLSVSPDGRWLFGMTSWRGTFVDIFDLKSGTLARRLMLPKGSLPSGEWLGDKFYVHALEEGRSRLWTITPEAQSLGPSVEIDLPNLPESRGPTFLDLLAGGNHLFLFEVFGHKLDPRRKGASLGGGVFVINPSSGEVISHLAPSVQLSRLVVSNDGQTLYGIDSGQLDWNGPVRLLKLDTERGAIVAQRSLDADVWSITKARVPTELIQRGLLGTEPCPGR